MLALGVSAGLDMDGRLGGGTGVIAFCPCADTDMDTAAGVVGGRGGGGLRDTGICDSLPRRGGGVKVGSSQEGERVGSVTGVGLTIMAGLVETRSLVARRCSSMSFRE